MDSDFSIKLQVSFKKCLPKIYLLFSLFVSYTEMQYRDLKSLHVSGFLSQGCSREYNQTFGYLKSPGWPGHHPNDMDCSIILRAPPNHTISLFFHAFSLEDSTHCSHDFLEVSASIQIL